MEDSWQLLVDGGLPLAARRRDSVPSPARLASAAVAALEQGPTGREAEALAAFVFAWHHHWPRSFAAELAADADRVLAWASHHACDDGRYVKLRRIALANLASVL